MKPNPDRLSRLCCYALGAAIALGSLPGAHAQTPPPAGAPAGTNAPTPAEYALGLLKRSADRLSTATNFTFKTTSSVEVISPVGHILNYFSAAEVAVHRPDKMMAKKTGDGPSFDLYYDGKNFGAVDPALNLYAEMAAPPTLDALVPAVEEKTGIQFPYADVLHSDVYGAVTKELTHAYWVGKTTVDGVVCDHLAFAGPGIEWQIWLGPEKDLLPRRLAVTYLEMERQPRFLVNFTDWNLKASLAASRFEFKKPAGAKPIEFRPLMTTSGK
jgi:hypothetical protein